MTYIISQQHLLQIAGNKSFPIISKHVCNSFSIQYIKELFKLHNDINFILEVDTKTQLIIAIELEIKYILCEFYSPNITDILEICEKKDILIFRNKKDILKFLNKYP